jgi:signal transduction histidine kinase
MRTSEGSFVIASVVDVSERKRSQLEAARQRDKMAHRARAAMLGEVSGSLAHEPNQPVSAILSNAQAAQRFLARDPQPAAVIGDPRRHREGPKGKDLSSMILDSIGRATPVLDRQQLAQSVQRLLREAFQGIVGGDHR